MPDDLASQLLAAYDAQPPVSNVEVNNVALPERKAPDRYAQYTRPGHSLDVTTGMGFFKRAGLSFIENAPNRLEFVKRAFNGSKVVQTPEGDLIVRNVIDPRSGIAKDLLVDEKDITLKDLGDMAAAGVKMAAEIALLRGVGVARSGLAKFTDRMSAPMRIGTESAAGAVISETIGLTTDALANSQATFSELVGEHARGALSQFGLGVGLGSAVEIGPGILNNSLGKLAGELAPGEVEQAGLAGIKAVYKDTGIELSPSVGQMAADPNVLQLETYLTRLPLFGAIFRRQRALREQATIDLQAQLRGDAPLLPMSKLGADLVDAVNQEVKRASSAAQLAETSLATRAASELETAITQIAPSAKPLTTDLTAGLTRFSASAQMNEFKGIADDLFAAAGNPEISTAPLKPLLADIKTSLPKKTVINESDLVNVAGQPLATTEGKEIIKEFVPTELQRFIHGLDSLDPTMPLDQLRRIRNTVDSAIREPRGLEGVTTYELKQLQHALTETINKGAETLGEAGKPLLRANAFYKENIERFEAPFVSRLLKDTPDAPGAIRNHELLNAVKNNADDFKDVERFLKSSVTEGGKAIGKTSERVWNAFRRSLLEDIYSRARVNPASSTSPINADAFLAELQSGAFKDPAIRARLLGASEEVVSKNLDLLSQLKAGFKDVPLSGLETFLRYPGNSIEDLSRLATARKNLDELFENNVIKKLLKGDDADINALRSDEGLNWLMKAKNRAEVAQVMAIAADNPALVENLRRNAVTRIFQEASQKVKSSDAARIGTDDYLVSPSRLIELFRDPQEASKLRIILGNETFNIVENFAKSQAVLGKEGMNTLTGSATATGIMVHMLKFLKDVPHAMKLTIYTAALTNKNLQRAIMEASLTPGVDAREFTTLLIGSAPVLDALSSQYGKTGTEMTLQIVKDAMEVGKAIMPRNDDTLNGRRRQRSEEERSPMPLEPEANDRAARLLELEQATKRTR